MSELKHVLKTKVEMLEKIQSFQKKIKELTDKINIINKEIYKMCKHEWTRDASCSDDDLGKNYCLKCGLRNYYMYK